MTPKERSLANQLRDAQAALPQEQLRRISAETAKDQAEATLRVTQADLDLALDVVVSQPAPDPVTSSSEDQDRYETLRKRYPDKFNQDE